MKLIGESTIPDPDTVGNWLRRMGGSESGEMGLKGLDKVRESINQRILRRDDVKECTLDADAEGSGTKF